MWGYYEYVPVSQKKDNAKKYIEKHRKKGQLFNPVVITDTKIAKTWWGIAWNKNLESYADYSNRIGRGKSYVKNGQVIDLTIDAGIINALVMGNGSKPYKTIIRIDPVSNASWKEITKRCANSVSSIGDLVMGIFPKSLESLFTQKEKGLFPSPKEIHFDCDCPDWADMCKHIAAVLYGVGAMLDNDPSLFFLLRDIKAEELLKKSVEEKMESMLANADRKSKRVINDGDIEDLFGISMEF